MPKIKKLINKYLYLITYILSAIIISAVLVIMIINEQRLSIQSSHAVFSQVKQHLETNQAELTEVVNEYAQSCLQNATSIAYIIEQDPSVLDDLAEMKRIARLIGVDEIHIFDKTGRIYTGTHPEYYDYTFDSGEQIGFFKPLLTDKSLKLCQEITPNTAEDKLMQYSALWSENGEFIVQVGMEPVNVVKATEKNQLSYVFSKLLVSTGATLYAINIESGEVVGSTSSADLGKQLSDLGFLPNRMQADTGSFHAKINGVNSYCTYTVYGDNYICRTISNDTLYHNIPSILLGLSVCMILIAHALVYCVQRYLGKYVINEIDTINDKLRLITEGHLNETVNIQGSQEFAELSSHINDMIKSLLSSTDKISYVLDQAKMPIGVYEYNKHIKEVRFTDHITNILCLDSLQVKKLASDYHIFNAYLSKIKANHLADEDGIFSLPNAPEHYIRLEEIDNKDSILGVIVDVTNDVLKQKKTESERDIDLLTGLYNRRALENKLTALLLSPQLLGHGALIMIDADGLKTINDKYGHEKGDIYIKEIANVIQSFAQCSYIAARQGGDEFVLFLYNYETENGLLNDLNALSYIQDNRMVALDKETTVPLRFSYGYSLINNNKDYQTLLCEADQKMYENKRYRKGQSLKE